MSALVATHRFSSSTLCADDVACSAARHTRASEEAACLPTLVVPRRGTFVWHSSRTSVVAEPNTVLLFDPALPHRITHPTDHGDDCTALRFSNDQIREILGASRQSPRYWILDAKSHIALHLAVQTIRRAADVLEGEEAAMAILRVLAQSEPPQTSAHSAVDLVRERIATNPGEPATLSELARGSGLSAYELARKFRSFTGSSIHQYRLRLRLLLALSRLHDGEDDLTALALDLGFASHAHFTSSFGRIFNTTPRYFRALSSVRRNA